jgi:L-ascorbate metabolism protein UlaG (beta-lactamase superfamily)
MNSFQAVHSSWLSIARPIGLCLCVVILSSLSVSAAEPPLTGDTIPTKDGPLIIHPINHATLAMSWKDVTIYSDPVGPAARFAGLPRPDVIVITDIHGDHMSAPTLKNLVSEKTVLVVPQAVADQLPADLKPHFTILKNGETKTVAGISIEALPMYNTTPERAQFHTKGRGNGYVITFGDKRVYLSGDTEDVPEMRALKNIDVAFICMNLPYTMTVDQAASAVREFRPKIVYPYHYRGSDLQKFKTLVGDDVGVEVRLRDWYQP